MSIEIIHSSLSELPRLEESIIHISVDRSVLAKRRWRATAEDGREFGFDLDEILSSGDTVFRDGAKCYVVTQNPEAIIEIRLEEGSEAAATLGWKMGNLHFPIQIANHHIRVAEDPAIRQVLDREGISYTLAEAVFRPLNASVHGHHH